MKTIEEIRRENARKLRRGLKSNTAFATIINREPTQISRLIGANPSKIIGSDLARHIEESFKLEKGWLDTNHENEVAEPTTKELVDRDQVLRRVPILSWAEIVTYVQNPPAETEQLNSQFPCPVPCSDRTFALEVNADSMLPEYRAGELIFIDPDVKKSAGDDVIAYFPLTGKLMFRRLVHDSGAVYLKALNETWPEPYVDATQDCVIIGKIIFSGKIRG